MKKFDEQEYILEVEQIISKLETLLEELSKYNMNKIFRDDDNYQICLDNIKQISDKIKGISG